MRAFEILSFITRNGRIYRKNRESIKLSSELDNVPGEITRRVRSQCAQGRCVIVLEENSIKPDFSRIFDSSKKILQTLHPDDFRTLTRNVEVLGGISCDEFRAHILRSFP
jgi:hypothetical protein